MTILYRHAILGSMAGIVSLLLLLYAASTAIVLCKFSQIESASVKPDVTRLNRAVTDVLNQMSISSRPILTMQRAEPIRGAASWGVIENSASSGGE